MNLITSEEEFYAGVTPANLHERLEQVEEPLKWRIMGDLGYCGFLKTVENFLSVLKKAADMGDMLSMVMLKFLLGSDRYDVFITSENSLAWTIYMCYYQGNAMYMDDLKKLAKTEIRALHYYSLLETSADYSELIRKKYLPALSRLAYKGSREAIVFGSQCGQNACRSLHVDLLKDVMSWTNLSFFTLSQPRQDCFIRRRLTSGDVTNVEIYIYGREKYFKDNEVYANICRHLQQWINAFSCCLLRLQTFPKDVRLLLTRYAWNNRYKHLEIGQCEK